MYTVNLFEKNHHTFSHQCVCINYWFYSVSKCIILLNTNRKRNEITPIYLLAL